MPRTYTPSRIGMAIVGAGVVLADTSLNVTNVYAQMGATGWDTIYVTIVLAIATTFGSYAVLECWRSPKWGERIAGCFIAAAVAVGMAYSFQHSIARYTSMYHAYLDRTAEARDMQLARHDPNLQEANQIQLQIEQSGFQAVIAKECTLTAERQVRVRAARRIEDGWGGSRIIKARYKTVRDSVSYDPTVHTASQFPKCVAAHQELKALQGQRAALLAMVKTRAPEVARWQVDPAAMSLALGLPISQEAISLYIPWLPALGLLLFSLMFALGMSGEPAPPPRFNLALGGDAQKIADAEEYIAMFKSSNGQWPTKADVSEVSGLTPQRAYTVLQRVKKRKK